MEARGKVGNERRGKRKEEVKGEGRGGVSRGKR